MNRCQCCIVGAGPAGMVLALLLARKGVHVQLLEVHRDLDRDFRGDTVHASTLEVLDQIGLADRLLDIPHAKMHQLSLHTSERVINAVSFARLRTRFPFIAMMPQHLFLNFLLTEASRYPNFTMRFETGVTGLIEEDGVVSGVTARHDEKDVLIRADLVVGCDGRFSRVRKLSGVEVIPQSAPMDVAWTRLSRKETDRDDGGAFYIGNGHLCVMLMREDEWQLGYVFPKGDFGEVRRRGIEHLRADIAGIVPWVADRVNEITGFEKVHLLKVSGDRVKRWHKPGLLLIGDAAHVMTPVGGVGINYAIGDAVEAANVLIPRFLAGDVIDDAILGEVQHRRERVTARMQSVQSLIQDTIVTAALSKQFNLPLPARIALSIPLLRDVPARIVALGFYRLRLEQGCL